MIVRWAPSEHYPWLAERAKIGIRSDLCALEAVSGDRIVGMVGFDGWSAGSCCMHNALDAPIAARKLLRASFEFVFTVSNRPVAIATVLSNNARALKLDLHLGFRELFRGKDWWEPGVDIVFLEMRREECRWLGKKVA